MKTYKNKIVFGGVLLLILLFLVGYTYLIMEEESDEQGLSAPALPEWQETGASFETKKEAIDAIKEERQKQLPSPYPDHMIDEKGYFNPDYMQMEKNRIIDSIYAREHFTPRPPAANAHSSKWSNLEHDSSNPRNVATKVISLENLGLEHQLFFAVNPAMVNPDLAVTAQILGSHTLRKDSRVPLEITSATGGKIKDVIMRAVLWGRVSFGSNRVFITVSNISGSAMVFEAYDLQDGQRGIYLENSFRAEASEQVLQDMAGDINLPGIPQLRGLKNVFRRRQRNPRVTLLDGHTFYLKSKS